MSKASDAANAVVNACGQVLDLYGVRYTREQSRTIMVEGAAGRWRPMYFGRWIDDNGEVHTSGRADILARPRILRDGWVISIPLWIECKAGKGRLTTDQAAFRKWVEDNGDHYLLIHDDVRPLIAWLTLRNVRKEPVGVIHSGTPLTTEAINMLPCRHCGDLKDKHDGTIHACRGKRFMGKVWSPSIRNTKEAK